MATPAFSPVGGAGTTYTDSDGTTYRFNGTKWVQISSGIKQTSTTVSQNTQPKTTGQIINFQELLAQFPGYAGWNPTAAMANYKATGGEGKGGPTGTTTTSTGSPLQDVNNLIQSTFQNLYSQATEKFGEYNKANPFNLDQVLANSLTQAKEQIDPYYNETLSNYLTGVTRRIARSKEDTQNLLGELNADASSFSNNLKIRLGSAIQQAQEGFAGAGLLQSGQALRSTGLTSVLGSNQLADYLRQNAYQQTQATLGGQRTLENIGLESTQQQRDIGREQFTEEQNRANQIAQETGQQYVRGFQQTLPPQLQANTGFDILKQLGIPS